MTGHYQRKEDDSGLTVTSLRVSTEDADKGCIVPNKYDVTEHVLLQLVQDTLKQCWQ